jgi:hypothetical protein
VTIVHAQGEGDDTPAALTAAAAEPVVLVAADRALRCSGADVVGPSWLLHRLIT